MTSPKRESLPYRDCVGIAVFNDRGEVFIGRRRADDLSEVTDPDALRWQMPQGGIDVGEAPVVAALRELFEETSIVSVELLAQAPDWIFYDLPDEALGIALKGRYRGQRQCWFAYRFTGNEAEINVKAPGDGTVAAEFDAWRWEALEALPDLIVPFKRDAYKQVVAAFRHIPARLSAR
jgi:putative (di)nucleoside polyphosphate hydrolase